MTFSAGTAMADDDDGAGVLITTLPLISGSNPALRIGVKACDSQGKVCSKMVASDSTVALTPPAFDAEQIKSVLITYYLSTFYRV